MVPDPNNLNSQKYFDRDWLKIDKLYIFADFWRKAGDLFLAFLLSLKGPMAEWLGRGLQNLLQRFESAWDLNKKTSQKRLCFFTLSKSGPVAEGLGEGPQDLLPWFESMRDLKCILVKKQ